MQQASPYPELFPEEETATGGSPYPELFPEETGVTASADPYPDLFPEEQQEDVMVIGPPDDAVPVTTAEKPQYEAAPVMGTAAAEDDVLGVSAAGVEMQPMTVPEYGKFLGESTAEVGKGVVSATTGLFGDLESLTYGIYSGIFDQEADEDFLDAFSRGAKEDTFFPTTEETGEFLFGPKEEGNVLRTAGEFLTAEGAIIGSIKRLKDAKKIVDAGATVGKVGREDAVQFMDAYQESLDVSRAAGMEAEDAVAKANDYFGVDNDYVRQMSEVSGTKMRIRTQKQAKQFLEGPVVVAGQGTDPTVSSRWMNWFGDKADDTLSAVDRGLGILSTRVKNISPRVFNRLREMDRRQHVRLHEAALKVNPFIKTLNNIDKDFKPDLDSALLSGRFDDVESILRVSGNSEGVTQFQEVRKLLEDLHQEAAGELGMQIGKLDNYFPRVIKDYKGLRRALELDPNKGPGVKTALAEARAKKGSKLTPDEEAEVVNLYVRGYPSDKINTGLTMFGKERLLNNIPEELLPYYANPGSSLQTYIQRMSNMIEQRKFLGESYIENDLGTIKFDDSVGALLAPELKSGKINDKDMDEMVQMLRARLNPKAMGGGSQFLKNVMYMGTLADPMAALTQIGDSLLTAFHSGIVPATESIARVVTRQNKIKLDDFGFKELTEDLSDVSRSRRALDALFKGTGFSTIDKVGKESILNGALIKYTNDVEDPVKLAKFKNEWKPAFGKDFDQLVADLKAGNTDSEHVKLLLWHKLADAQPISLSEVPEKYLKMEGGKIIYMLKTFTLKQFDIVRRQAIQKIKDPKTRQEGMRNLARYGIYFTAAGASTDQIKNAILGRDVEWGEVVEDNLYKMVGFNRYTLGQMERQPIEALGQSIYLPPVSVFDNLLRGAIEAIVDGEVTGKLVKTLPFGDLYESHYMGGKEKFKERQEAKKMKEANFRLGGMLDQARQMFKNGGVVRKPFEAGGLGDNNFDQQVAEQDKKPMYFQEEDSSTRDPLSPSLEGVERNTRPEFMDNLLQENTIEGVTFLPGLVADTATGNLPRGIVKSIDNYLANKDDSENKWLPLTDKLASGTKEVLGVEEIPPESDEEHIAKLIMDPTLFSFGSLVKRGETAGTIAKSAPNYLPGFYGNLGQKIGSLIVGGSKAAVGALENLFTPSGIAAARDIHYGQSVRRLIQDQVKVYNKFLKNKPALQAAIDEAPDLAAKKEAQKAFKAAKDEHNQAAKVIAGQLTYNANVMKQMGEKSPLLDEWVATTAKGSMKLDRDSFSLVREASDVDHALFTKADEDTFFKHLTEIHGYAKKDGKKSVKDQVKDLAKKGLNIDRSKKDVQMVLRPAGGFGGAGNFVNDMFRNSSQHKSLEVIASNSTNYDSFMKELNDFNSKAKSKDKINVIATNPEDGTVFVTYGMKSSSYAEGGINVIEAIKTNSKNADSFVMYSDDHDILGILPDSFDNLVAVSPITRQPLLQGSTKGGSATRGETYTGSRRKKKFEKQNENEVAAQIEAGEFEQTAPSRKGEYEAMLLSGEKGIQDFNATQTKLINKILETQPDPTNFDRAVAAIRASILNKLEDDNDPIMTEEQRQARLEALTTDYGDETSGMKLGGMLDQTRKLFKNGGVADGNLNEEMTPEYDETMDALPVEEPKTVLVSQTEAPQKPSIKMPEKKGKEPVKSEHDEYLDRLATVESSNDVNAYAESSGALGLYQFIPSTWNNMVDRYMPELKKQKGDFMEFRRNPEVSRYMARKLMEENANILKRKGYKDTKGNLYLAHFAGPGKAVKLLGANPNTPVDTIMSKKAIANNPGVFNKVRTAGQLIRWAQIKMALKKKN